MEAVHNCRYALATLVDHIQRTSNETSLTKIKQAADDREKTEKWTVVQADCHPEIAKYSFWTSAVALTITGIALVKFWDQKELFTAISGIGTQATSATNALLAGSAQKRQTVAGGQAQIYQTKVANNQQQGPQEIVQTAIRALEAEGQAYLSAAR